MDFMGVLSPPAAATAAGTGHGGTRAASTARDVHMKPPDRSQVHAAAHALPPPPQTTSVVVDGRMPPPAAVASLTLQVAGAQDVASLATSASFSRMGCVSSRSTAVSETTEQLTILALRLCLTSDNTPREKAEETMFLAAKTTPDAGCRPVRQKQLLQLQSAAAPAYPNKRQRTFWHQAHEKDPDGLFIHKNKTSACTQHMSPENGQAIIKETNQCSPQIQIVPRADVSLLLRNASLVSFMERRKQRLASAAVAYPRREKSPDEKDTFPLASPRNKTPLGDMEQQWAFTNAKNISGNHDDEALDTELKI